MTAEDWEAWCDATADLDDEPPDLGWDEEEPDPVPGEQLAWTAGFAKGGDVDGMAGGSALAFLADAAAGDDDRYAGATDGELDGAIAAWDRIEAHASARKHLAIAEFIRRNPEQGCEPKHLDGMPAQWDEFAVDELRVLLAESKAAVERMMDRALSLAARLPGTMALYRSGKLRQSKVTIIVDVTAPLDDEESKAAEEKVLGRAHRLTPSGLRHAVAQAVMDVAPDKAKKVRENASKDARVERWVEDSGNAALMGRELPPDEVLAADQRITAWAHELRKAGLDGDMDVLRARAYLDLLLDKDSRPEPGDGPAMQDVAPGGFAVRGNLTVPLADLTGLADRPGQMSGFGAIDPWLARDLAAAAARNPRTSWCVTAVNGYGHAAFHGCARPEPKIRPKPKSRPQRGRHGKLEKPGTAAGAARDGPGPGSAAGSRDGPGFSFTLENRDGPPGGLGTWRLRCPGPGPDLIVELYSLSTEGCDHRFQAKGHDPGVRLRHLAQIRHATCTSPVCRRPAGQCDFEHYVPFEAGGRTCLCNGGPKCRHDHRLKQQPGWKVDQLPDGRFRWTTPSGRDYITEPTRYPI
ncbi:MAG TPA: DUF222 domain-containing protein [Streptosporangiaceae bacterium]|nr:DUF222 domain-containing protein [Streptosporangiaceae bacterium]